MPHVSCYLAPGKEVCHTSTCQHTGISLLNTGDYLLTAVGDCPEHLCTYLWQMPKQMPLCLQLLHMMSCISLVSISKSCTDQTVSRRIPMLADYVFVGKAIPVFRGLSFWRHSRGSVQEPRHFFYRSSCGVNSTSSPSIKMYGVTSAIGITVAFWR